MALDTTKITGAADELSAGLAKGGTAAKTLGAEIANAIKALNDRVSTLEAGGGTITHRSRRKPPALDEGKIRNFNATGSFTIGGVNVSNADREESLELDQDRRLFAAVRTSQW